VTSKREQKEIDTTTKLIELAFEEDFSDLGDLTSLAMIPKEATATVQIVAREQGILAGFAVVKQLFAMLDKSVQVKQLVADGDVLKPQMVVAEVSGSLQSLLAGERIALNFLTHLSGIATLTRQFVDAVQGTKAQILDTRKTQPGYRLLEKQAVRAGGGTNHRMGLYDGCMIKDNHIAGWKENAADDFDDSIAAAIQYVREQITVNVPIEVEVDQLTQLEDVLDAQPDIVLLDNMSLDMLREAVAIRDKISPPTLLEASGGVTLATVAEIAKTGIERISVGALTHSAMGLDLAFDWK